MAPAQALHGLPTVLFDSANFIATKLRYGMTLRSLNGRGEVYFQPGDDESAFIATLDALDEIADPFKREIVFDILCGEYL